MNLAIGSSPRALVFALFLVLITHEACSNDLKDEGVPLVEIGTEFVVQTAENKTLEKEIKPYRLPTTVVPRHYKLQVLHVLDEVKNCSGTSNGQLDSCPVNRIKGRKSSSTRNKNESFPKLFTAPSKVWIEVEVVETTREIILHADNMTIDFLEVKNLQSNETLASPSITRDLNETFFLTLTLPKELDVGGRYSIYIEFTAWIADDRLNGLYLDYYYDPRTEEKRYLATTLFAPNHARKAFPCFDEPGLRATFEIIIGRLERKYQSLSNMNKISTAPIEGMPGWVWDSFATTPSMSTYIVAMITCDFQSRDYFYMSALQSRNVTLKAFVPNYLLSYKNSTTSSSSEAAASSPTDYALNVMEKSFPYFEGLLMAEFPLEKLYVISLPHFYFSAMENWGMMTFKDPVLLSVQNVTTENERDRISEVVNHEVVHQWFGNLVGLDFWSVVWLKEGFSVYFSYHGTELSHPELHAWTHFIFKSLQVALQFDQGLDSHPLFNQPKAAADIGDIYTKIPYQKGASILRMTAGFMTPLTFMRGIQLYVERMKYKSATEEDLFQALQDADDKTGQRLARQNLASGISIKDILTTWTRQGGFPLVRVKVIEDQGILHLSQETFENPMVKQVKIIYPSKSLKNIDENSSWWIPITLDPKLFSYNKSSETDMYYTDVWIPENEKEIFVDYPHSKELFTVNPGATGYYRVLYDSSQLIDRIQMQLINNHTAIRDVARSQLLDDYFSLAFAKYVPIELTLNLTKYLTKETELVVWETVMENFKISYELLRGTEYFPSFQKYIVKLLKPVWKLSQSQLKDLQDITEKTRLHSLLLRSLCCYDPLGDECFQLVKSYYAQWIENKDVNPIPADYQGTLYCAIASTATPDNINSTWTFFEDLYQKEYFSVQKSRYLKALGCFNDTEHLQKLLNWTTDPNHVELHDINRVEIIQFVAANPIGKPLVIEFLDNNFNILFKTASAANPVTEGMKKVIPYLNSIEDQETLATFVSKYSKELGSKKKGLEKLMSKVNLNVLWMEEFGPRIKSWMEHELSSSSSR